MLHKTVVLLALLTSFSLQAALGPGAEIPVTPPAYGALPGSQDTMATATDGTDFLALWRDDTPGRDGIYATIVSENGTTRPAAPVPLARGYAGVDAVWTGNSYLVVVTRYLEPSFVIRLSRDGEVVSPLRRVDFGPDAAIAAIAWNGERALAIAYGLSSVSAVLLDAEGNAIRAGIQLPAGIHDYTLSTAGDAFILVWTERLVPQQGSTPPNTRVRAIRISEQGDVSAPVELLEPEHSYVSVDSASNGAEAGVVVTTGNSHNAVLRRYTIDETLAVEAEPPLALAPFTNSNVDVVATPHGFIASYFALVVNQGQELRVLPFGSTTHSTIDIPQSPGYGLLLESNGRAIMGFWGAYFARAAAFDASLTRMTSAIFPVTSAPVRQDRPVIASAGDTGVIAWNEFGTLKLRRIDREGHALDAQPLVIATNADRAAVVFTGQLWLIAWFDVTAGVKMRRMSAEGVLLGEPVDLGDLATADLALASNGNVVAMVTSLGVNRRGLVLTRFSADGERLDASPIVLTDARSSDHPAIASNGEGFLVAWNHSAGYTPHLYGKRLDASGNPIEAEPIAIANGAGFGHGNAQVASNGEDYLVVYVRYGEFEIYDPPLPDGPHAEPARIFTKRVLANGVLGDTTPDQDGAELGLGTNPAITADDSRYVATFTKADQDTLWLFAVPLHPYGEPLTAPRLLLRAESHAQEHGIASIGGALLTAYSRVVPELTSVQRVFLREVAEQQTTRRRGSRN